MYRLAHIQRCCHHICLEECTSSVTSYISKCVDDVVITKIIPKPESLDEWRTEGPIQSQKSCLSVSRQRGIQHHQSQTESCMKEAKRRNQERLERDLNTNNTKDMWKAIQTITGYKSRSAPLSSCVRPRCQVSLTPFTLALISSTKSQLSSLLCLQRTGHCQYPQWM